MRFESISTIAPTRVPAKAVSAGLVALGSNETTSYQHTFERLTFHSIADEVEQHHPSFFVDLNATGRPAVEAQGRGTPRRVLSTEL